MMRDGAKCRDEVRLLRSEFALMGILGTKILPSTHSIANLLREVV